MNVSKKQFAINAIWKMLEQFSAKGISMIVSIVLLRILEPSDYGLIALTAVFTNLSDILIDGGFSTALICKEKIDEYDYSAVFAVSSTISVILYAALFISAPFVATYYESPELTQVLRVIGVVFFIQAFTAVRNGIVNRTMQFKLLFACNTIASILSGIIGIIAAYSGLGVWALVIQRMTQQLISTIVLFIKVDWKVQWRFDFSRIKEMLSFSIGVVGSSLLCYFGGNIYSIAIGKKYSVTDLGYYDKGNQLPMQFSLYTLGAMSTVLLPTISSCQDDIERVKRIFRKVVRMTGFLIFPMMVGLALISEEIISLLFTSKWLYAVPVMECACLYYSSTAFLLISIQVFFAMGYSNLRGKIEIIRLGLMAAGLGIFGYVYDCSMNQLALVGAIIAAIVSCVTYCEIRKLINYEISEVISDLWKSVLSSAIMGFILIMIDGAIVIDSEIICLFVKIFVGTVVYVVLAYLFKIPEKDDFIKLISIGRSYE